MKAECIIYLDTQELDYCCQQLVVDTLTVGKLAIWKNHLQLNGKEIRKCPYCKAKIIARRKNELRDGKRSPEDCRRN